MIDDDDVLAQFLDEVELMTGEQHGRARGRDLGEQFGHVLDRDRVESGERFVEYEQLRVVDERGDQLHPLLVPVRQGVEAILGPVGETETRQPRVDTPTDARGGRAAELAEVDELIPHAHPRVQAALLRHVAEARTVDRCDARALPPHDAGVELDETEHRAHGRRLARAVRAEEAGEPARPRGKRAPVKRRQRTEPLGRLMELEHDSPPGPSILRQPRG